MPCHAKQVTEQYLIASGKPAGHSHLLPFSLAVVSGGPKGS